MKISVLITTMLIVQVSSTSFFDLFHGAVQSVQNGFGKLLTDVVTDVKETVDCTILAVQQMLSLSEDATRRYYEKCGNGMNSTDGNTTSVEGLQPVNEENLDKEIDDKINKTVSKVLDDYKPDERIIELEKLLVKESEQLADVNDLLKKEIKKLSEEVGKDFKNIKHNDTDSSVETILHEIKILEKKELNTRNTSEAREIQHVMSQVLDKIDAIEATEATENVKLDEIVRDLQNKSKDESIVLLKQEIKEWEEEESKNLDQLKKEVQEHEKIIDRPKIEPECNHTQPVILNIGIPKNPTGRSLNSPEISSENITHTRFINDGAGNNKSVTSLDHIKPSNETIQAVKLTKQVNPEPEPLITTKSTMNQTIINENKSNEAITIDNIHVTTESVEEKSKDYMVHKDTVREVQNIGDRNNTETTRSSITTDTKSTEKVQPSAVLSNETVTSANVESIVMTRLQNNLSETNLTSIPIFLYDGLISANKPIQLEELTTLRNEEITATVKPNDTVARSLPTTDNTSGSEAISLKLLTTTDNKNNTSVTTEPYNPLTSELSITDSAHVSETSTIEELTTLDNEDFHTMIAHLNDTVTINLPVIDSLPVSKNIPLLELTTVSNEDNPTIITDPNDTATRISPIADSLPASEYISLLKLTTVVNEDNPTIITDPNDTATRNAPIVDSLAVSENIPLIELTTVGNEDNPTIITDPNDTTTRNSSIADSLPASENIPLVELATVGNEDNPTIITDPNDTATMNSPIADSLPTSENIPLVELATVGNEDNPTIIADPNDTATRNSPIADSLPASENIPLVELTTVGNEDNPTIITDSNDTATMNSPITDSLPASENTPLVELTTVGNEDNPTIITDPNDTATMNSTVADSLPTSENIPLIELTTVVKEDNPAIATEPDDKVTINLPMKDSLPVSKTIPGEEFTTANNDDNPPNQSIIESTPAYENIPHEELTTDNNEDNSTFTTEPYESVTPDQSTTDTSKNANVSLEELITAVNADTIVTTELNDTVTLGVSITDTLPTSETIPSEVTSAMLDGIESTVTTQSNPTTQNGANITNTSNTPEEETTPCCKDFEETLKKPIDENSTRSIAIENSPPTEIPTLAIVTTTETSGTILTTQIPTLRSGLVNDKNASFDYDSFFPSQTNKVVRQRAINEARQLMKGRKRSERIINNILKNKRKGALSLFNGPVPINSGK